MLAAFDIPTQVLSHFLSVVCAGYHANPYHNFTHCIHVLHGCFMLLRGGSDGAHSASLTAVEKLCLLVAALGHDIDHPGCNNQFMVNTGAPLALRYNDISVLENHHAATTFAVLADARTNLFVNLSADDGKQARKLIIKAILATDMTHHADMVKDLAERAAESKPVEPVDVLQTFLHLADLGNCVIDWRLSKRWACRVCEESTAQANKELELGLPVPAHVKLTAYSDKEVAARQLIFLDGWVRSPPRLPHASRPDAATRTPSHRRHARRCGRSSRRRPFSSPR